MHSLLKLIFLLLCFFVSSLCAQAYKTYNYDAEGNRVYKEVSPSQYKKMKSKKYSYIYKGGAHSRRVPKRTYYYKGKSKSKS